MAKVLNYAQEGKFILDKLPVEDKKIGDTILMLTKQAENYRAKGQYEEAKYCCDKAIALTQDPDLDKPDELDVKYAEGFVKMHLGTIYLSQGKFKQAADRYRQAQKLFSERNKPYSEGIAWMALGIAYHAQARNNPNSVGSGDDEWKEAMKAYQRSFDIFRKLDKPKLMGEVRGRLKSVNDQYQQAMEEFCRKEEARKKQREKPREEEMEKEGVMPLTFILPSGEEVLQVPIPIVAKIAAGRELTLAEENILGYLMLDEEHARNATFALRVEGNSMINAHITNGDYVLIHAQEEVENSEIAAVRISQEMEEAVLKQLYEEKFDEEVYYRLEPENDQEPTIIVVSNPDLKERIAERSKEQGKRVEIIVGTPAVEGKVVGVVRTFREMQTSK